MYVATNGNIKSSTDPDFIHFTDEQTGILLPNIPGYPAWLPNMQLTPSGRLCFWNFPNTIYKSVVSNPTNVGNSQYLRNSKAVTASNQYPPVPAATLGTNGSNNQYFWNSCDTYFKIDSVFQPTYIQIMGLELNAANWTIGNWVYPWKLGAMISLQPWDWIELQVQYYIGRYLKNPYSLRDATPYTLNWISQLNKAAQTGDVQKWLSACNFLIEPTGTPDFWTKTLNTLPTAILGIVAGVASIMTAGAATPELVAALGAMGGAVKASANQNQQITDAQTQAALNRVVNTQQVQTDVSTLAGTTSDINKFIFFGALVILIAIILIIKTKSK